ncbi:MAG: hypothetical protein O7F08_11670, partial [Deltaproteobacteria bacterium]|nr:hypothetical protein [Deltaproteobacteria bacterium]
MSWQSARRNFYNRAEPRSDTPQLRLQAELDVALRRLHGRAGQLIGATTHSDPGERDRLVAAVARGEHAKPRWKWRPVPVETSVWRELDRAQHLAERSVASALYLPRLEELETELLLLESLGQSKRVRPMAARLFGTGAERVFEDDP